MCVAFQNAAMSKRQRLESSTSWEPVNPEPTRIIPRRGWLALRGSGQRTARRTAAEVIWASMVRNKDPR